MQSLATFLILQLDRIKGRPIAHAPGPKKPSLQNQDYGKGLK